MIKNQSAASEHTNIGTEKVFSKKKIYKGLTYFVIFTITGLAIIFFYTNTPQTMKSLRYLKAHFICIAIVLSFLDMWLGAMRYHIFVRKIKPGTTPWLCFRANLANIFIGAVTPSQSGGGPAQLYIFYRGGIPLTVAVSLSVITFICTLGFFLVAASFSLIIVHEQFSQQAILYLVKYGFIAFTGFFVFFIFPYGDLIY